jgi:hypothetical protein
MAIAIGPTITINRIASTTPPTNHGKINILIFTASVETSKKKVKRLRADSAAE